MKKKIFLLISDISIYYLSLAVIIILRLNKDLTFELIKGHIIHFSVVGIIWLAVFYSVGFYNLNFYKNKTDFVSKIIKVFFLLFLMSGIYFYFLVDSISPKTNLVLFFLYYILMFFITRLLIVKFISLREGSKKILFIGSKNQYLMIKGLVSLKPINEYTIKSKYLLDEINSNKLAVKINEDEIIKTIKAYNISLIVYGLDQNDDKNIINALYKLLYQDLEYVFYSDFIEKYTKQVPFNILDEFWFFQNLAKGSNKLYLLVKNIFDIILSFLLLILTFPFLIIISVIIKLTSRGPIFFTQKRVGKNNRIFNLIKFRTMYLNSEAKGPQWTTVNDPRITKFGGFLRKSHVDEIPQLFNIIKGEMSFVGPRPERPEFVKDLSKEILFYDIRSIVKPGITGWAQIMYKYGDSINDASEKLKYDLYYIKYRSFLLDLKILIKTAYKLFERDGR